MVAQTALLKRPRSVLHALAKVEVEQAKATVTDEQNMILAEVNEHFIDKDGVRHFKKVDGGEMGLCVSLSHISCSKVILRGESWMLQGLKVSIRLWPQNCATSAQRQKQLNS